MFKKVLISLVLAIIPCGLTGCATILGGIIGYQSGELAAGMAIGAAVDFGDDIVRGIGQMGAKEKDLRQDFLKKSTLDTKAGKITLPINPFNEERIFTLTQQLRKKFQENGWTCQQTEKTACWSWSFENSRTEKWSCTANEQPFEFKVDFNSSRDTRFTVSPIDGCREKDALRPRPAAGA